MQSDEEDHLVWAALLADMNKRFVFIYLFIYLYSTVTKISLPYVITIRLHVCDVNSCLFQKEQEKKWIHEIHADWQNYGEYHTSVPE